VKAYSATQRVLKRSEYNSIQRLTQARSSAFVKHLVVVQHICVVMKTLFTAAAAAAVVV
jgi:hypothetical protein